MPTGLFQFITFLQDNFVNKNRDQQPWISFLDIPLDKAANMRVFADSDTVSTYQVSSVQLMTNEYLFYDDLTYCSKEFM